MSEPQELLDLLRRDIAESVADKGRAAVSYSGGVDSSVLARLASEVSEVRAYSCATEGSFDARNVMQCASDEHLSLKLVIMTPLDVRRYIGNAASVLGTREPIPVAYTIPVLRVVDECTEHVVIIGNGADELLAGYSRYERDSDAQASMLKDFDKMRSELGKLQSYACSLGKMLVAPFAARSVADFAHALPLDRKLSPEGRKLILREAASQLGLPSCSRAKKAAQYSSGVLKEMERQAKAEGLPLKEWTAKVSSE